MRKLIVPAIALVFIIASVSAYACDGHNSSAKKVDASKVETQTTQASVQTSDARVETAQATKASGSSCSAAKAMKTNQVNSSSCCTGIKAKAMTAEAHSSCSGAKATTAEMKMSDDGIKAQHADVKNCPMTPDCNPANCPYMNKMSKQTSAKDKMTENTGDSQAKTASVAMAPKSAKEDK